MKIGIDISQIAYEGTGVARYVQEMVRALLRQDKENSYILFASSLRHKNVFTEFFLSLHDTSGRVRLKIFLFPPIVLDILWNRLQLLPIEWLIGTIDVFWSSDWVQPPLVQAKGITTIHDLSFFRFPEESHNQTAFEAKNINIKANIVATQKRRLFRSKTICSTFLCDSESTLRDAHTFLGISSNKMIVVYPGYKKI